MEEILINGYTIKEYLKNFMELFGDGHLDNLINVADNGWYDEDTDEWIRPELDGHTIDCVESEGGTIGDGERCHVVLGVFDVSTETAIAYMRVDGYYDSYNGTEWYPGFTPVYPRAVTVIKYFKEGE